MSEKKKRIKTTKEILEEAKKLKISPKAKAVVASVIAKSKEEGTYPY